MASFGTAVLPDTYQEGPVITGQGIPQGVVNYSTALLPEFEQADTDTLISIGQLYPR